MIEQVIDGLSQGNQLEGVLSGVNMLSFVPIHESASCWEHLIIDWIRTCTSYPELEPLTEKGWLWEGQGLADHNWDNVDGMEFPLKGDNYLLI